MDQARPHAGDLVRDNAGAHAAAADGHAAVDLSASHRSDQGHDKIRIVVVRRRLAVAEVEHFVASPAQHLDQIFLQRKTSVVGGDPDEFWRFRRYCWAIRH